VAFVIFYFFFKKFFKNKNKSEKIPKRLKNENISRKINKNGKKILQNEK